jgi:hypothetical protein
MGKLGMSCEPRVFLSYSSKDSALAQLVYDHLKFSGIRALKAPDDIPPGHDWANSIVEMIESSSHLVLLWTQHSVMSKEVSKELTLAMSTGLRIIPFKTTGGEPQGAWRYHLANLQWLDASDLDRSIALQELAAQILPSISASELSHRKIVNESPDCSPGKRQNGLGTISLFMTLAALGVNLFALLLGIWFGLASPALSAAAIKNITIIYQMIPPASFALYAGSTAIAVFAMARGSNQRLAVFSMALTAVQIVCYLLGTIMGILPR